MQIAEPGESQIKEACRKRVVGIDLGTTNSLVAHVVDGTPTVITGGDATAGDDAALVPSIVHYGADGVVVGHRAAELAAEHPRDTIVSVKRFVGRGLRDLASQRALLPYELAPDDGRMVRFVVGAGDARREITPVEVSADILRAVAARATAAVGGAIEGVVITVPAYFDDAQRQATRDAGRLAGLEVLRLLAEPT
ncbi:MAG: Hsp70 family protein, partial [Myxococcales bacterium]|nr:Hsp70 family protein [Myxococcales bacterium]